MNRHRVCGLMMLALLPCAVRAAEISIAVASNFTAPMQDIAAEFEKQTGHKVRAVSGSSGKFYAQIRHGAPFQAFLAADREKPLRLEEHGLTVPGSRFTYAIGRLALWSPRRGFVDVAGRVLQEGGFDKLAIANPVHAPYGAAAFEVLRRLGLMESLRDRLVFGESVAQAYQFVESGNAELGFVALSQILADGMMKTGSAWTVPPELHRPIRQDAVLLRTGASPQDSAGALELLHFMRGPAARAIITAHGYETAGAP